MWGCSNCGETVEPPLEVCWNCGTSQDGGRDPDFKAADDLSASDTADLPRLDADLSNSDASVERESLPKTKFYLCAFLGVVATGVILMAVILWWEQPRASADYYHLAITKLRLGDHSGAIAHLTRAIELVEDEDNPSLLKAFYAARAAARSDVANSSRDYANALRDISRAIDLHDSERASRENGFLFRHASAEWYVPLTEKHFCRWHLLRAVAFVALEQEERALPDLEIVLKAEPKNQAALHLLAIAEGREENDLVEEGSDGTD